MHPAQRRQHMNPQCVRTVASDRAIPTRILKVVFVIALCALAIAPAKAANGSGAIYTTTASATTVNANIYAAKSDVYLSGGPQNKQDPGLGPDGTYYFQVTDPSGAVLLSTDDINCPQVVGPNGRLDGD